MTYNVLSGTLSLYTTTTTTVGKFSLLRLYSGARLRVYVIYLPAHCAGVSNMSPHYSLSPAVKMSHRYCRMRFCSTNQEDHRLLVEDMLR